MRKGGPPKKKKNKKVHKNKYAHMSNSLGEKEIEKYKLLVENLSSYSKLDQMDFYSDFNRIKHNPTKENYSKMKSYYYRIFNENNQRNKDLTSLF